MAFGCFNWSSIRIFRRGQLSPLSLAGVSLKLNNLPDLFSTSCATWSVETCSAGPRERIPTGTGEVARPYHFYGAYQRFNSNQKQRPSRQSFCRTLLGQKTLLCLMVLQNPLQRTS